MNVARFLDTFGGGCEHTCARSAYPYRSRITQEPHDLNISFVYSPFRTKWKRQTIVGFEIMAENNFAVAAFQQLYGSGAATVPTHPAAGRYWPYPSTHPLQTNGLFYQQASAAVTLQKPLPYRLYPPTMILAGPSNPLGSLTASSSLSNLSNYYRDSPEMADGRDRESMERSSRQRDRSKSPVVRDRSPLMKEERLYAPTMVQAGSSNALGNITGSSSLSNLSNYYRDSPEMAEGRENMSRASRQRDRSKSPALRDRSPICKDDRLYPPTMLQAGPSNTIGSMTANSGLSNLGSFYRDCPDMVEGRDRENLSRGTRQRERSASRSPKRVDSPQSIRADSDEESIHDI